MKKTKLNLDELRIQSFVTETDKASLLRGGSLKVLQDQSIAVPQCRYYDLTARCQTALTQCPEIVCG